MALKELLTNLEDALASYPNHNQPSTTGGFNYGQSTTRIFDGKTFRQKSFKFGEGTAFDQPGGSFSKMPYLYNGFLSADNLPDVPNPGDQSMISKVGDFVDSATDGLIRGGLITAIKRSGQDLLRIGKWMLDCPKGPVWLLTQTGLQRSNPKIAEKGASIFGIDLGGTSRTYNPLGLNTLAQTLTSFSGLHIGRSGLWPLGEKNYKLETGHNIDSTNDTKYEFNVRGSGDLIGDSWVDNMSWDGINRLLTLHKDVILHNRDGKMGNDHLYTYSGGPHSIYGIGKTKIKRYEHTEGPLSKQQKLESLGLLNNLSFINYNAGIEQYSPYNITFEEGGKKYNIGQIDPKKGPRRKSQPYDKQRLDERGHKIIWMPKDFVEHPRGSYKIKTSGITDFRKDRGVPWTSYQEETSNGKKFIREQRVNLGNPGTTKINKFSYNAYMPETVDTINALDVIRTNGEFTDQRFRDLIRFRIEAVDTDKPEQAETMIFRAFLDDFKDNYNANWNTFKYNGRGEEFYTYNSFKRTLSFSFKVAAQTRWEMMPLYRKLNFLVSNTAPEYKQTRMRGSFIRLTIGSMIDRTPGILNSISLSWKKDYPWEISIDSPESGKDKDMLVLPHVLDVNVQFTPVHNFLPQKSITDSPFIISHENNRHLTDGQKWYKAGAAGAEYDKETKQNKHKGTKTALDEASVEGLLLRLRENGMQVGVPGDVSDVPTMGEREAAPVNKIEPKNPEPIPTTNDTPELQKAQPPGSKIEPTKEQAEAEAKKKKQQQRAADDALRKSSKTGAGVKNDSSDKKDEVSNKQSDASGQKAASDPTTINQSTFQSTDSLPEGTKHGDVVDTHRGIVIVSYQEGTTNDLIYGMKIVGTDYTIHGEWYEDVDHYGYTGALELLREAIDFDVAAFKKARENSAPMGIGWYGKDAKKPVPKDAKGVKLTAQETIDAY